MVKKPTCFKNPAKPSCIDLKIKIKPRMFRSAKTYEIDLSDSHKLVETTKYKKRPPRMIKCRDDIKLLNKNFKNILNENLANNTELDFNRFEEIVLNLLSSQAPFKQRMIRKNQRVFMNII